MKKTKTKTKMHDFALREARHFWGVALREGDVGRQMVARFRAELIEGRADEEEAVLGDA